MNVEGLWDNAPLISSYSRADAIADGTLVDVTGPATREHGIKHPVAFTAAAHASVVALTPAAERAGNDVTGRLCDVFTMYRHAARRARSAREMRFTVLCVVDEIEPVDVELKATIGPGDDASPVITLSLAEEME